MVRPGRGDKGNQEDIGVAASRFPLGSVNKPPLHTRRCGTKNESAAIVKALSDTVPFLAYPQSSGLTPFLYAATEEVGNLDGKRFVKALDG
jgi:hypothetical protein